MIGSRLQMKWRNYPKIDAEVEQILAETIDGSFNGFEIPHPASMKSSGNTWTCLRTIFTAHEQR